MFRWRIALVDRAPEVIKNWLRTRTKGRDVRIVMLSKSSKAGWCPDVTEFWRLAGGRQEQLGVGCWHWESGGRGTRGARRG